MLAVPGGRSGTLYENVSSGSDLAHAIRLSRCQTSRTAGGDIDDEFRTAVMRLPGDADLTPPAPPARPKRSQRKVDRRTKDKLRLRAGLDMDKAIDVIAQGAAQSWQMENRAETMIGDKYDFGFAVDWMRKDLGICLDESRRNGARLPVAALVDQFYAAVQERGGNRWDTSSLMRLLTTP